MDSEQFVYWLHGFFEISDAKTLTETQVQIIKDHLDLVFNKVTPDRKIFTPKEINNNPLEQIKYCANLRVGNPFEPYTKSTDSDSQGLIKNQFDFFAVGSGKLPYNYGEEPSYGFIYKPEEVIVTC